MIFVAEAGSYKIHVDPIFRFYQIYWEDKGDLVTLERNVPGSLLIPERVPRSVHLALVEAWLMAHVHLPKDIRLPLVEAIRDLEKEIAQKVRASEPTIRFCLNPEGSGFYMSTVLCWKIKREQYEDKLVEFQLHRISDKPQKRLAGELDVDSVVHLVSQYKYRDFFWLRSGLEMKNLPVPVIDACIANCEHAIAQHGSGNS